MTLLRPGGRIFALPPLLALLALAQSGCAGPEAAGAIAAGGIVATTLVLSRSPSHEIEQVYYLGVFDPLEQVPPSFYRITVHGQASAMSSTKFASGWVPAAVIDSLNTRIRFSDESDALEIMTADEATSSSIKTGRGLILFGPEGFREAPRDHRLVIVMGSNPSAYFDAIDGVLGEIAAQRRPPPTVDKERGRIIEALFKVQDQKSAIEAKQKEIQK